MQKEASLQEKALELFLIQEDEGEVDFEILKEYSTYALKALEDFLFKGAMSSIVQFYGLEKIVFTVELCTEEKILDLNSNYRNKDKVTDVLSFPTQEDLRNKNAEIFIPELELGDIFICSQVCQQQSEEFGISFADEFVHLLVHGLLHLCGFDHEISSSEEQLMEKLEKEILDKISQVKG